MSLKGMTPIFTFDELEIVGVSQLPGYGAMVGLFGQLVAEGCNTVTRSTPWCLLSISRDLFHQMLDEDLDLRAQYKGSRGYYYFRAVEFSEEEPISLAKRFPRTPRGLCFANNYRAFWVRRFEDAPDIRWEAETSVSAH